MSEILRKSKTSYGDWKGTSAADQHQTSGHKTAYEMIGLDSDKWWIVGYDFLSENLNDVRGIYVYAVDRQLYSISNYQAIQAYGDAHGSIPVTSFLVHDITPADFIAEVFNQFQIQLRSRSIGHDISVMEQADLNYVE